MPTAVDLRRFQSTRARMLAVGLLLALSIVALPGRADAHPVSGGGGGGAIGLINQARAGYGLDSLAYDDELQAVAARQASRMAESGSVFHTRNLGDKLSWGWWAWAENVGYGPSVAWIHNAFLNSGSHRSNILSSRYNYVGVGVAYGGDGTVYVAQVFGAW